MNHENYEIPQSQGQSSTHWDILTELEQSVQPEQMPSDFDRLNAIADDVDIKILTQLNSTNPEAKQEFLNNPNLERPNNEWTKLDGPLCEDNLRRIDATLGELSQVNLSYPERLLLQTELNFSRKKNRLAAATYNFNHATTEEERNAIAAEHQAANRELYGMPDEATFHALLSQKLNKITPTPEIQQTHDELIALLGNIPRLGGENLYAPQPETIQRFGEMMREFYKPFLQHIPTDQEIFTPDDAASIVNKVLRDEVGQTEWQAVVEPHAGLASVDTKTKRINFPGSRSKGDYTRLELEKIIIHELGTHALRAISYEDSPIQVFRTESFEGRETFEEGIAKVMEQALEGRADDPESPAPSRYIMIGLANFRQTNFRQTFEIMRRLESLTGGWNEGQIYDNLQRVYRGTGVLPNNKDLAYYNGNVEAWKYIESHLDDPSLFDDIFLSGKIDPRNSDQAYLSYELRAGALGK